MRWSSSARYATRLKNICQIEQLSLREFRHFARRHRRYLLLLPVMYGYALHRPQVGRALRAAYCLAQHLDDVLDGDRPINGDPAHYVAGLVRQIEGDEYDPTQPAGVLAHYVMHYADRVQATGDDFRGDFLGLIEALQFDYDRRLARCSLPAANLLDQHRRTFHYSINLALILVQADFRATAVPNLIDAFSWCSPVRDLQEDLQNGLINIPAEVIETANRLNHPLDLPALLAAPAVQDWLAAEYRRGLTALDAAAIELAALKGRRGAVEAGAFRLALKQYAARYTATTATARCSAVVTHPQPSSTTGDQTCSPH
jgi:hypothetical protein